MPYKEKEVKKLYYSIGEVAREFDVNASLIRFWEKEFDVIKPKKNSKGNRLFTEKDINNLRVIYDLVKKQGYTLQGAKDHLKAKKRNKRSGSKQEVITSLKNIQVKLRSLKEEVSGTEL